MNLEFILSSILIFLGILNLLFFISISNFIVKIADNLNSLRKDFDEFDDNYNSKKVNRVESKEDKGLIDI